MKYFSVIDTNVLVSALLHRNSPPGQVVTEALAGCITPLLSQEILDEYRSVLHRPKFCFPADAVNIFIEGIIQRGIFVDPIPSDEIFSDPNDLIFYNVFLTFQKEDIITYLITGNLKHFPKTSFIISPRTMIDIINFDFT